MTIAPETPATPSSSRLPGRWIAIAALGGAMVIGASWFLKTRSVKKAPAYSDKSAVRVRETTSRSPEFDVTLEVPGSPLGAASNGREIILGNRKAPWGAIRIRHVGTEYVAEQIPILESRYQQSISITALTWNGTNYVGLTTGSWFGMADRSVFTIHDSDTLGVIGTHDAPPLLGGLAWDGSSYWASTRKNTADSIEEAFLYRLDSNFNVVGTSAPPGVGCQGLAWDGAHLWFVDAFENAIYVLDISQPEPRVIHRSSTPGSSPSGVVWHDDAIWIADYDEDRLQRMRETTRAAWLGTTPHSKTTSAASSPATTSGEATLESTIESIDELRRMLRNDSWSERMRAKAKLDAAGAPIDFARNQNHFIDRRSDNTEDVDWSIELRDNAVWIVSSRVWFGHDLFKSRPPNPSIVTVPVFARYTFTTRKPDGSVTEKQFAATAGDNLVSGIRLAEANAAGKYEVSLFMYAQYIDASGAGQILNNSAGSLDLRK